MSEIGISITLSIVTLIVTVFLTIYSIKIQSNVNQINKKLELKQQFVLEKRKYLFESRINAIDEMINSFLELKVHIRCFLNKTIDHDKKQEEIKIFSIYADSSLISFTRPMAYLGPEFVRECNKITSMVDKIAKIHMNDLDVSRKEYDILFDKIDDFIRMLETEKEKLCNE